MLGSQDNWILCDGGPGQFQDGSGSHLLTVKANVSNQHAFWFDQIQYAPSASVSLSQSLLHIDSGDSASSGWQFSGESIYYNSTRALSGVNSSITIQNTGATLTYRFTGS